MTDFNENNQEIFIQRNENNEEKNEDINSENLNIYDNILENQIQRSSFLTNIPSNNNYLEKKQKLNELKHLTEKKNSLIKQINYVKNKKNEMNEISFTNVNKAEIDSNILNSDIKNMNSLQKNLIDKLNEVNEQIKTLNGNSENEKGINSEIIKSNQETTKYDENDIKEQLLNHNRIRLKEIENKYKKMKREKSNNENNLNIKKMKNLNMNDEEEFRMMKKRQYELKKKIENLKNDVMPYSNPSECLYQIMERNYKDKENKFIKEASAERKLKNILYKPTFDLKKEKLDYQNHKKELEKRAEEQKYNMKKLWNSRSMLLKQYQKSNGYKTEQNKDIIIMKNDKIKNRKDYSETKVKLPPIDEKLKEESEWRLIDIKNLKDKERINYVNKKYIQKGLKIFNSFHNLNHGKKFVFRKNNCFSHEKIRSNTHNLKYKNLLIKNNNTVKKKKEVSPKEINYLKELKNKKKREFHKWNIYIKNKEVKEIDTEGITLINKKIERLDEKVRLSKEIMNLNGGFKKNLELGNELNNLLIDSIKGKIAILDELYNYEDE